MKVFTYGTLKAGYRNHRFLLGSDYLGDATTFKRYRMVDVKFPVLLQATDTACHRVRGEVYEVNRETLAQLDRLESKGRMYNRVRRYVRMDGKTVRVYYYVGIEEYWNRPTLPDGYLKAVPPTNGHYNWKELDRLDA